MLSIVDAKPPAPAQLRSLSSSDSGSSPGELLILRRESGNMSA